MYAPSAEDVRRFFCAAWQKRRDGVPMTPLEAVAADWAADHPEYQGDLSDAEAAVAADYPIDAGRTNPFLHLSMHLSISEQLAIDRPRGIKQAVELLTRRTGSAHAAQHAVMECLGEMMWASQRSGLPPDDAAYLACIQRKATQVGRTGPSSSGR